MDLNNLISNIESGLYSLFGFDSDSDEDIPPPPRVNQRLREHQRVMDRKIQAAHEVATQIKNSQKFYENNPSLREWQGLGLYQFPTPVARDRRLPFMEPAPITRVSEDYLYLGNDALGVADKNLRAKTDKEKRKLRDEIIRVGGGHPTEGFSPEERRFRF
tara:strand:+ start:570 stop:1049 length:480 start_codon:yes stop_codon:yes gene_type:complete